jgi:hypothetical protein
MECAEHAFIDCLETERNSSLHIVESLLRFAEINVPNCFDLYPILTFDTLLQKLLKIRIV